MRWKRWAFALRLKPVKTSRLPSSSSRLFDVPGFIPRSQRISYDYASK